MVSVRYTYYKEFVSANIRIFKACSGSEVLIRSFTGCDSNLTQLTTTFNDEYRFPKKNSEVF